MEVFSYDAASNKTHYKAEACSRNGINQYTFPVQCNVCFYLHPSLPVRAVAYHMLLTVLLFCLDRLKAGP